MKKKGKLSSVSNGRWGKRKKPKRDWKTYNRKLVGRGELLIPFGKAKEWERELKAMNQDKEGAPFQYPSQLIECLLFWKFLLKSPYRLIGGLGKGLLGLFDIATTPDYSTLCRRMKSLGKKYYTERKKVENEEAIYAAFDGTGLKVFNRGEWMHYKHKGKRKGFVRVCFMFNTKTGEILDFSATTEGVAEQDKIRPMIKRTAKNRNIDKLAIDGAGDDWRNFELIKQLKIKPAIKIRQNANPYLLMEDPRRRERLKEVLKVQKWGYQGWAKRRKYGQRWQSEGGISCFKGYFGEYVFSRGMSKIKAEVGLKVHFYNRLRSM